MTGALAGIVLGLLVGLRHAFEPDHLSAVSTLVAEAKDGRRGALLGAMWGLGHTLALVVVGIVLMTVGATLPEPVAAGFECVVSAMLIVLGIRAIVRAPAAPAPAAKGPFTLRPVQPHWHGPFAHVHSEAASHLHVTRNTAVLRPLLVGLVHGLAGSGALTALVFAELPTTSLRIAYITLFGVGSIAGMAIASGIAGASLHALARRPSTRRRVSQLAGAVSIIVGCLWAIPMIAVLRG